MKAPHRITLSTILLAAGVMIPTTLVAFPPTMWTRPDTISEWTDPLEEVWNSIPDYDGEVAADWAHMPIQEGAKVLCIGNSLSGWGAPIDENIPAVYNYLNPGKNIHVKLLGRGSAWLRDYLAETELGILDSIRSGRYDFLICQPWGDAMWPRSDGLDEQRNLNSDSLIAHFVQPCDSFYRECRKVGTQMVVWSPNGSQFDDRTVYLTYSSFNSKQIAKRLNIPYAFTAEAFDSIYMESDDPELVWYDNVHESPEMSAVNALLLYNVLTQGAPVSGMPQNWLDVPNTQWATAYEEAPRSEFISQELLTKWVAYFADEQSIFNTIGATDAVSPKLNMVSHMGPLPTQQRLFYNISGRRIPADFKGYSATQFRIETPRQGAKKGTASMKIFAR